MKVERFLGVFAAGAAALLACYGVPSAHAEPGTDALLSTIRLVHDGRFDEAEEALSRADPKPDPVALSFFSSFVVYWRLLYDPDNSGLQSLLDRRLNATLEMTRARLKEDPGDAGTRLWEGTSHLFLAELLGARGKEWSAAMEARKARRQLERALEADPSLADACFGLGTINLLADRLPGILKGIGALLGLSGSRSEGLSQLERAAEESRYFRLEARIFLMTAHANRHERRYVEALAEAERVAALSPASVAARDGAARVELGLGLAERAASRLDAALESAGAAARTDGTVVATLVIHRAQAEFARFRPDLTLEYLHRLLAIPGTLPDDLRKDALQLLRDAASLAGGPSWLADLAVRLGDSTGITSKYANLYPIQSASWRRALPALETERTAGTGTAIESLATLRSETADDPVISLLYGRALVRLGRGSEARPVLAAAERSGGVPLPWQGPLWILSGQAADLAADRSAALAYYKKADDWPRFIERDSAHLYSLTPYRGSS